MQVFEEPTFYTPGPLNLATCAARAGVDEVSSRAEAVAHDVIPLFWMCWIVSVDEEPGTAAGARVRARGSTSLMRGKG